MAGVDDDGDGLSGDEEVGHGADPLLADSDGDGFGDGSEVAAGTDPLDPETFPPGAIPVASLTLAGRVLLAGLLAAAGVGIPPVRASSRRV